MQLARVTNFRSRLSSLFIARRATDQIRTTGVRPSVTADRGHTFRVCVCRTTVSDNEWPGAFASGRGESRNAAYPLPSPPPPPRLSSLLLTAAFSRVAGSAGIGLSTCGEAEISGTLSAASREEEGGGGGGGEAVGSREGEREREFGHGA